MADNHQHRGNSQVMTRNESQAARAHVVVNSMTPTNVAELHSYQGLLKYYMNFLPYLSKLLAPLNALTHSCAEWSWDAACERAFKNSKELICKAGILCHYDPSNH